MKDVTSAGDATSDIGAVRWVASPALTSTLTEMKSARPGLVRFVDSPTPYKSRIGYLVTPSGVTFTVQKLRWMC